MVYVQIDRREEADLTAGWAAQGQDLSSLLDPCPPEACGPAEFVVVPARQRQRLRFADSNHPSPGVVPAQRQGLDFGTGQAVAVGAGGALVGRVEVDDRPGDRLHVLGPAAEDVDAGEVGRVAQPSFDAVDP